MSYLSSRFQLTLLSKMMLSSLLLSAAATAAEQGQATPDGTLLELQDTHIQETAEEQIKQSLGVSVITAEDIARRPPVNDLSDIIRREPGVNLTGNSATGLRGNNRQIDIRGMGPENTLILIDGRPATSRNSVRYGWSGDRDTRGDSNWVPAEQVERIEVLRGPAAARYGSGAMGGVVNIITKAPAQKATGSITYFANRPQDAKEGDTNRASFSFSGPLSDTLSGRLYGNVNKTDPDARDINQDEVGSGQLTAGREGVVNKDINSMLSWRADEWNTFDLEVGFSRQGNRYAGDSPYYLDSNIENMYDHETNTLYRQSFAITHRGDYEWGRSQTSLSHDITRNKRQREGLTGRVEGAPAAGDSSSAGVFDTSKLKNTRLLTQVDVPFAVSGIDQVMTAGLEANREHLNDPGGMRQSINPGGTGGSVTENVSGTEVTLNSQALYVESNISATQDLTLTPGLRFDHSGTFGNNWSPSLNAEYRLTDEWKIKGGVARAYKAPNLYQATDNYLLSSRGNGCWRAAGATGRSCYLEGNEDLKPETSINKEIGIAFDGGDLRSSLTYFRNDYRNKIDAGTRAVRVINGQDVYQWENTDKALVQGIEGNLFIALSEALEWNTNLTYMIDSEKRSGPFKGEPLSIIPKYTLNSTLDWFVTEQLSVQATATWYGKQTPPTLAQTGSAISAQDEIAPYALFGIGSGYAFNEHLALRVGVSNLFDKRLYRKGNAESVGAQTYNEPGRAFYASVTTSF
ncbi:FepA family TonB-dependent siderophore receptor [Pseudomonas sp. LRF_L74]|uniref:FepA family TonB-dependent siderophore receptor n=1 Tax=Pseudomonas sp. LRF_L74 TaxID=3369422 RepID=UPI003F62E0F6